MGLIGGIFKALGFESDKKVKNNKHKTKASYILKNKKSKRTEQIDGVPVYYPENLEQLKQFLDFVKQKKAIIISLESCDKNLNESLINFMQGVSFALELKFIALNEDKLYLILPEGMEIEE